MRLLVLSMDYPRPDGTHERMYVHVRDIYYQKQGYEVTVLNFSCNYDYEIDGIRVITLATYEKELSEGSKYDILLSHASNLRNHYRFLRRHDYEFTHIVFFFHGHEVLYLNKDYPKPYSYLKKSDLKNGFAQNVYDTVKIFLWERYYKKNIKKIEFVFVSNWIKTKFMQYLHFSEKDFNGKSQIINNSIGGAFEEAFYDIYAEKKYDFITIRSIMDGSKYCIDLVDRLAQQYPEKSFLIIGRGDYFKHNKKPGNITWVDKSLNHEEMFAFLNSSKCGLLLTREDTQGVMTCEFAAFGIPTITSDIEVCHEFFEDMPNVALISNDLTDNICAISNELWRSVPYKKDDTYFACNTISKETALFEKLIGEGRNK